jgi:hypothetical protein
MAVEYLGRVFQLGESAVHAIRVREISTACKLSRFLTEIPSDES